jgi:hypothetical protein
MINYPNILWNSISNAEIKDMGYEEEDPDFFKKWETSKCKYTHKRDNKFWTGTKKSISGSIAHTILGMHCENIVEKYNLPWWFKNNEAHKCLIKNIQASKYENIPTNAAMQYGKIHENLSIATLLMNFGGKYKKNGAWTINHNNSTILSFNDGIFCPSEILLPQYKENIFPVEIKTVSAFKNKNNKIIYTNTVPKDEIAIEYVPQLVLEAAAVNKDYLLFVSSGQFKTNIFVFKRDIELETTLLNILSYINELCINDSKNIEETYNILFSTPEHQRLLSKFLEISKNTPPTWTVNTYPGWSTTNLFFKKIN